MVFNHNFNILTRPISNNTNRNINNIDNELNNNINDDIDLYNNNNINDLYNSFELFIDLSQNNNNSYDNNNNNQNINNIDNNEMIDNLYNSSIFSERRNISNSANDNRVDGPIKKKLLEKLPESKIDDIDKLIDENKRCTICLEDFIKNDIVIYLPCFHIFHKLCIIEWINKHANCPLCKLNINEILINISN